MRLEYANITHLKHSANTLVAQLVRHLPSITTTRDQIWFSHPTVPDVFERFGRFFTNLSKLLRSETLITCLNGYH